MLETKGNAHCYNPPQWLLHPGLLKPYSIYLWKHHIWHITTHFSSHSSPRIYVHLVPVSSLVLLPVKDSTFFIQFYDLRRQPPDAFAPILGNLEHWQMPANPWGSYTEKSKSMVRNHWHYQPLPKSTFDYCNPTSLQVFCFRLRMQAQHGTTCTMQRDPHDPSCELLANYHHGICHDATLGTSFESLHPRS